MKDRRHLFLWPVLVIGIALIAMPFAMSMPSKTDAAQRMMDDFRPAMQTASVVQTAAHYYEAFMKSALGTQTSQAIAGAASKRVPQLAPLAAGAVAALHHYKPWLDTMQANVTNFRELDDLPSFGVFTWIFVIPGALLVLIAGVPLLMGLSKRTAARTA